MAPKHKRSDAGNSDEPKRSHEVRPLREKVKVLDLIRKEKKSYAEVAKTYGKSESSWNCEEGKWIHADFAVPPQLQKLQPQ